MSTPQNVDNMVTEILAGADARDCSLCGKRSSVPVRDSLKHLWFCFECGNEEKHPPLTSTHPDAE